MSWQQSHTVESARDTVGTIDTSQSFASIDKAALWLRDARYIPAIGEPGHIFYCTRFSRSIRAQIIADEHGRFKIRFKIVASAT